MSNLLWNELDSGYQEAEEVSSGGYELLPTGEYTFRIVEMRYNENDVCIERGFQVVDGEHAGKRQKEWVRLLKKDKTRNDYNLGRLKAEIKLFDPTFAMLQLSEALMPFINGALNQLCTGYVSTKPAIDKESGEQMCTKDGTPMVNSTIYINKFLTPETFGVPSQQATQQGSIVNPNCNDITF